MNVIRPAILFSCVTAFAIFSQPAAAQILDNDRQFAVEFVYDASAHPEEIYTTLQSKASSACRLDLRQAVGVGRKTSYEKACRETLMSAVVERLGNENLLALHHQKTGISAPSRKFTGLR